MKIEDIIKVEKALEPSKRSVVNLIYAGNYVTLKLNNSLKPYGISLQQFNVLRILRGQKGKSLNLYQIQERMINKNSNSTRLIDKLITKSYVSRIIDKTNRRKIKVSITAEGLKLLKSLDSIIDEKEEKLILKNLNHKDREQLNLLLEKLHD